MADFIKKNWIHGLAVLIFLMLSLAHFYPVLQGKQVDFAERLEGTAKEMRDHQEETGEVTRWTNALFSGMPTYYILSKTPQDLTSFSYKLSRLFLPKEIGIFVSGMLLFYVLMLLIGVSPPISIIAAISFAFATNNLILFDTGHMTKLRTIMTAPLLISGIILALKDKKLLGLLVFALGMSMNLRADHPQMTYYLGLMLVPLVLIYYYDLIKSKSYKELGLTSLGFILALFLALGAGASKILPAKEYADDTMRGKPVLKKNTSSFSSSSVDGLSWDYAMNWSNGTIDLLQSFIPYSVGGSTTEMLDNQSSFAKEMRRLGANTRKGIQAPLYWGGLPSTSGPIYFGAVVFLLFFIGLFAVNDKLKWWALIAVLLGFFFSLGRNFEIFNRFFFDFVPLFNKFRTPNSVLSVTTIIIPILSFYGLHKIIHDKPDIKKVIYPGLGLAAFCLLYGFMAPSFFDMTGAYDARYAQSGINMDSLMKDRADFAMSSSMRSATYMLLTCALIWLVLKNKLKSIYAVMAIGVLSLIDLVGINTNYITPADYISDSSFKKTYTPRAVDNEILKDPDIHYRVFDLSVPTFESSFTSYFHKSIGGYHAAKLVRYQDMIDYHISRNNMDVLNMLNAKYFITPEDQGGERVQRNTAHLGNAWFVNNIQIVSSNEAEIQSLNEFDPLGVAIVHNEFESYVSNRNFQKDGSIRLTSYEPNALTYDFNSASDQI